MKTNLESQNEKLKKGAKTRMEILETALKLFCESGFEKTTLRDIAAKTELAVGAFYYYFGSKEEIVFAFYEQTHQEAMAHNKEIILKTKNFKNRLEDLIQFKFTQFKPYRPFIHVMVQFALDPTNSFSPFSMQSKPYRDQAIRMLAEIIAGSDLRIGKNMETLPTLLWAYQMAVTLFWIYDKSENQSRTKELINLGNEIIVKLIKMSSLPPLKSFTSTLDALVKTIIDNEQNS